MFNELVEMEMELEPIQSAEVLDLLAKLTILLSCALVFQLAFKQINLESCVSYVSAAQSYLKSRWELLIYPITANGKLRIAYSQMNGKPVRINAPESWMTLVSSPDLIEGIKSATNDELSLQAVAKEMLKPEYTMNGFNWHDKRGVEGTGFVRTLRTLLTRHLPQLTPVVRTIIDRAFTQEVGSGRSVNALALCKTTVTRISAYAFFGLDYVENDEFIEAAYSYSEDVLLGSELLHLTPKFLEPLVGKILPFFLKRQRTFFNGLVTIIEDRLNYPDAAKKHNDVIQWIIDTSPKSTPWTPGRIALEVMAVWFGSVQGLATALTFAIYSLCENPEYINPLREEIEGPAGGRFLVEGEGLPLMDSFLKECSRWTPLESLTARRCALKDFIFHDGTRVAKGEWVAIPVGPMLRDASKYPHPEVFDGFRFVDPKELGRDVSIQPEGPSKFTDVSDTWHVWGTGKMTCPGRFFVSYVMKHMMYHIVENYEPEMAERKRKYTMNWRTLTLPAPGIKVHFKARV